MKEILLVLTDRLHRSGFKYQTLIFMSLLRIVGFGLVVDEANGLTQENVTLVAAVAAAVAAAAAAVAAAAAAAAAGLPNSAANAGKQQQQH